MTLQFEKIQNEIEDCDNCSEQSKCKNHKIKLREARRRQDMISDPQRNRIGVKGDPIPDREYGI